MAGLLTKYKLKYVSTEYFTPDTATSYVDLHVSRQAGGWYIQDPPCFSDGNSERKTYRMVKQSEASLEALGKYSREQIIGRKNLQMNARFAAHTEHDANERKTRSSHRT